MLTITSARAPRWDDAENTALSLLVIFEELKDVGEMPYTAHANDSEAHCRQLFERAVAGEFGTIAPFVPRVLTEEQVRAQWKAERQKLIDAITVTTSTGRVFDGDELSQDRMARAVVSLMAQPPKATVLWVLADNSYAYVDFAELSQALKLARERQTELWVQP